VTDADSPVPLCTATNFQESPFGDLVAKYTEQALADLMTESTRICESKCGGRRFAPFTVTETHRADAIDPDEYSDQSNLPMDIQSTLGTSYAQALGASSLVRHTWIDQCAPLYQDLWTYSNVSVTVIRSYGGTQDLTAGQILNGPEPDTGHLWFQLGLFLPVGSRVQVTYSGGYTVAIPGDLVRAARLMAAWQVVSDLNPDDTSHDPDRLYGSALKILESYGAGAQSQGFG
jgi:hypothetical protein